MPPKSKQLFTLTPDLAIIEEIAYGDTKFRLVISPSGKKYIQLWSSLSKQWNIMYRYDVETNWNSWKRLVDAKLHTQKPEKQRRKRSNNVVDGTAKPSKRKPRTKSSTLHAKDSKPARNNTRKNK